MFVTEFPDWRQIESTKKQQDSILVYNAALRLLLFFSSMFVLKCMYWNVWAILMHYHMKWTKFNMLENYSWK